MIVDVKNPDLKAEVVLFQGNFTIFTIDDLATRLKLAVPNLKFGFAMNESKPKLTRVIGTDSLLTELAGKNAVAIGAGHVGVILLRDAYPVNVLAVIKNHPCVCRVYAASSNPLQVIVAETRLGRAVLGVVDGTASIGVESQAQEVERRSLVKKIGYGV